MPFSKLLIDFRVVMKINLSGFKPLIFFLFILTYINVSSQTKNEVYKRYNSSNYKNIQGANSEIDFENIDYKLLNALIFFKTNEERVNHQLAPLEYLENLEISATLHANNMVKYSFFDHINSYDKSKSTPSDRGRLSGILNPRMAENIAESFAIEYDGGKSVYVIDAKNGLFSYEYNGTVIKNRTYLSCAENLVSMWLGSPGHRANILNVNALQMGCGMAFYRDKEFNNIAMFKAVQNFQWYEKAKI